MNTLIVDCDGVLLNWRDGFNNWIHSHGLVDTHDDWDMTQYNPPETKLPLDVSKRLMNIFNQTHFISKLSPVPGAVKAIRKLHEYGFNIHVITAFSNEYEAIKMREQNLINAFGPVFQELSCVPIRTPKTEYLSKMPKDSYYVEDVAKHLQEGSDVGLSDRRLFLIPQPWNLADHNANAKPKYRRMHWHHISSELQGD